MISHSQGVLDGSGAGAVALPCSGRLLFLPEKRCCVYVERLVASDGCATPARTVFVSLHKESLGTRTRGDKAFSAKIGDIFFSFCFFVYPCVVTFIAIVNMMKTPDSCREFAVHE